MVSTIPHSCIVLSPCSYSRLWLGLGLGAGSSRLLSSRGCPPRGGGGRRSRLFLPPRRPRLGGGGGESARGRLSLLRALRCSMVSSGLGSSMSAGASKKPGSAVGGGGELGSKNPSSFAWLRWPRMMRPITLVSGLRDRPSASGSGTDALTRYTSSSPRLMGRATGGGPGGGPGRGVMGALGGIGGGGGGKRRVVGEADSPATGAAEARGPSGAGATGREASGAGASAAESAASNSCASARATFALGAASEPASSWGASALSSILGTSGARAVCCRDRKAIGAGELLSDDDASEGASPLERGSIASLGPSSRRRFPVCLVWRDPEAGGEAAGGRL